MTKSALIASVVLATLAIGVHADSNVLHSVKELDLLISQASFSNAVVVKYYSSRDSKVSTLSSAFTKIADAFKTLPVKFAQVDVDEVADVLKSQGLKPKSLPTFKLYLGGKKSYELPGKLEGKVDEVASKVINWIFEEVKKLTLESAGLKYTKPTSQEQKKQTKGSGPVDLTEANFKAKVLDVSSDSIALVEFFAPWCGHCKALAPVYEQVAKTVHGDPDVYGEKTIIGAVDATVHQSLAQTYGIQGFPTIKLFVGGKFKLDYNGPRDAASILEFVKSNLPPKRVESTLRQLTDIESDFEDECMKAPLCVLSFLPSLYDCDAKCRKKYIQMLKDEANAEDGTGTGRGWLFLWTEGASTEEAIKFEENLGVGPGLGYPNLVLINGKKEKYAPFKGSFSPAGLKEFLKAIIYGAKGASPLYPLPAVDKLTNQLKSSGQGKLKQWDGKDAPPLDDGGDSKDEL